MRVSNIEATLFLDRSAQQLTRGTAAPIAGEQAFGVDLQVSLNPPSPISVIIIDPAMKYSGNSYFRLHGGLSSRLDLVLLANPSSPGGYANGGAPLNPPPNDNSGIQHTYRAIRQQSSWTPSEQAAAANLVETFVKFVPDNLESDDPGFIRVATNLSGALERLGIDPRILVKSSKLETHAQQEPEFA